jgi:3-hydroxy-9,10-secoandrosta-1,3,5(10)-triene-9,17-dione monooxygenase
LWFDDVAAGTVPGLSDPANRMARFGYPTFGAAALVGPMLGMAKGALDWFIEAMKSKLRVTLKPGAPLPAAASPFVQARIGAAATMIEAALALLTREFGHAEAKITAGEVLSITERVHLRGALGFAARQAVLATNLLAEASGGSAAAIDVPIQRFWRDVNAAGRHVSLDAQGLEALVGQERLGLPLLGIY